jgi:hypothetical protein
MAKAKEDFIYVLQLENGKWYVGRSSDPASRIRRHQAGCGSSWTKRYAPIEVVSVSAGDGFEESKRTLELMSLHGIDNVRGGRFCQVVLAEDDIYFLEMELRHASDRCLRCGRAGHFMRFCRAKSEVASVPPDSVVAPAAQQDDEEEEDEKEQEEKSGDDAASASNAELYAEVPMFSFSRSPDQAGAASGPAQGTRHTRPRSRLRHLHQCHAAAHRISTSHVGR